MNYSKTIRQYCLYNPGSVFDVSFEMKRHFSMVPYKTLLKIMNRLEGEGIVKTFSKGIYLINGGNDSVDPIIKFYANETSGMVVGYSMYNKHKITNYNDGKIVIFTNAMETSVKNIGDKYTLVRFPLGSFFERDVATIEALEIIENSPNIIGLDEGNKANAIIELSNNIVKLKWEAEAIFKCKKYKYSTVCTLDMVLKNLNSKIDILTPFREVDKNE